MATDVYIVRHGEAEGNLYRRAQGHTDGDLTDMGMRQLEVLRKRFEGIKLDAAYSSDLTRAYLTGRAVCDPIGVEVRKDSDFREIGLGIWEDMPWGMIVRDYKEQYKLFDRKPYEWQIEGAEPYRTAGLRFLNALIQKAKEHDGQTIAIFAHGTVIRAALMEYFSRYPETRDTKVDHCDNTAITFLSIDADKIELKYLYDSAHLGKLSTYNRHIGLLESKNFKTNAWFRPMNPEEDAELYKRFRADAWQMVYEGAYDPEADYNAAIMKLIAEPESIAFAILEGEVIGVIELDAAQGEAQKQGVISFFYLKPEFRGMSLGAQLIGCAVSFFRARGRERLMIRVPESNEYAIGFCGYYGFERAGSDGSGTLICMEKDIRKTTARRTGDTK